MARFRLKFGRVDFFVPEIIKVVPLADGAQDAAGIADRHDVCGEVAGDDAARADHGIVADRDARQDDRARADPAVSADADGEIVLIYFLPQRGLNGMSRRRHGDVGAEHRVVAHIDRRVVHESQVEIGVDVFAEADEFPRPVGVEGGLDIASLPDLREHLF